MVGKKDLNSVGQRENYLVGMLEKKKAAKTARMWAAALVARSADNLASSKAVMSADHLVQWTEAKSDQN